MPGFCLASAINSESLSTPSFGLRGEHDRLLGKLDHRHEVFQRIEAHLEDVRRARHLVRRDQDRVAVRRALGGELEADVAAAARFVLDHDLLAEHARQVIGDGAGADVGRAAGREGHDEMDRPGRPALRRGDRRSERNERQDRGSEREHSASEIAPDFRVRASTIVAVLPPAG